MNIQDFVFFVVSWYCMCFKCPPSTKWKYWTVSNRKSYIIKKIGEIGKTHKHHQLVSLLSFLLCLKTGPPQPAGEARAAIFIAVYLSLPMTD